MSVAMGFANRERAIELAIISAFAWSEVITAADIQGPDASPKCAQCANSFSEIAAETADQQRRHDERLRDVRNPAEVLRHYLRLPDKRIDFVLSPLLCGARNRRLPLQMDGWRTAPFMAPHNRDIYIIGQSRHSVRS